MAVGLQLGIDQAVVEADLKTASFRWHQDERFDLGFELFQQFGC
jgi:hypothetical protein